MNKGKMAVMINNNLDDFIIEGDTLIRYTGEDDNVVIPGFVKRIGRIAFIGNSKLISVTIPEGTTSIGEHAFHGCGNLTNVMIPKSVTSIGEYTFYDCHSLTNITIPESVTSIGQNAFWCCKSLTSVTIPGSVMNIGESAFYGCENLTDVTICEGVTEIGKSAFEFCSSLTSITISEGVKKIGRDAFSGCVSLTRVMIPESVTSIGEANFVRCFQLADNDGFVVFRNKLCFYAGPGGNVRIPEGVTEIGGRAFSGCVSLTRVTIPDGVTRIGFSTFKNCSGLTRVTIPTSVTKIGSGAFEGCENLTSVTIPKGMEEIGINAFKACRSLKSVTIPEGMMSIGESAFGNCRSISTIYSNTRLVKGIFDEKFSNPVITNDPGMLPNNMKPLAAIGFAENPDAPASDRGKKHLKYIKANAAKLKDEAFSHPTLLRLMCYNKLLSPEVTDLYLSAAREKGNTELTAMLLDYQQNRLTGKEKEKAAQKAESREEKVTEFVFSVEAMEQLQGKIFVVTGKLTTFSSRDEFMACLDACGAILSETLNERTNYLITNTPNSGSAKNKKADALGVIKLSEVEFNHMIGRKLQ